MENRLLMKKVIALLFLSFYGYAVIRYHIGKDLVGLMEFFFVLNKAFAWTAGTLLLLSILPTNYLDKFQLTRRAFGTFGYAVALIHINSTILLLSEKFYPKFYTDEALNADGWFFIALGVSSILLFTLPLIASFKNLPSTHILYRFGRYGILMNLAHVAAIGYKGWLKFQDWPYFMPPITLLFSLNVVVIFVIRYWVLRRGK
jgi:hypothetical protein